MNLTSAQITNALRQLNRETEPVRITDDKYFSLRNLFGNHTFFSDSGGLKIIQPVGQSAEPKDNYCETVNLAAWQGEIGDLLIPHREIRTGVVILLAPGNELMRSRFGKMIVRFRRDRRDLTVAKRSKPAPLHKSQS